MRLITRLALSAALLAVATPAMAEVTVSFLDPENYSDASLYNRYGEKGREPALRGIREHLLHLGERHLQPGQTLTVEVLDIDLAGRFEWWHATAYDVRFLREITWPRMTLRYDLRENGGTITSGEESIADLAYLMNAGVSRSSDPLRYEKAMLDDWFRMRIVEKLTPQS